MKAQGFFTVGSTKDQVLAEQGTPTEFADTEFTYGLSRVKFQNGRVILVNGLVAKAGISAGSFGDIQGCVPTLREVPRASGGGYPMGAGLLTTVNVMGTALINAHRCAQIAPRGCRLAVDPALLSNRPTGVVISDFGGPVVVDWVHTRTAAMEIISQKAGLNLPPTSELEKRLGAYVAGTGSLTGSDWARNTLAMNNCACPSAKVS